jgi:hypothetical protein
LIIIDHETDVKTKQDPTFVDPKYNTDLYKELIEAYRGHTIFKINGSETPTLRKLLLACSGGPAGLPGAERLERMERYDGPFEVCSKLSYIGGPLDIH